MKFCSNCNLEYDDKYAFCHKCGNKLEVKEDKPVCPNCGKVIEKVAEFCPFCGTAITDTRSIFDSNTNINTQKENQSNLKSYKEIVEEAQNDPERTETFESVSKGIGKMLIFCVVIPFLLLVIYGFYEYKTQNKNNSSANSSGANDTMATTNVVSNSSPNKNINLKNSVIPDNFEPFKALDATIYLPRKFKKYDNPTVGNLNQGIESGIALAGEVEKNDNTEKDYRLNRFNVMVMFAKSPELLKLKSSEEESALEATFKRYWQSSGQTSKVATKRELLSKQFCKTNNGHKYLRAVFISGIPNKPNIDVLHNVAFYIFGDTMYHVDLDALRNNEKHNNDFEVILNTFDASSKKVAIEIENEAIAFYKLYHKATENGDYELAFSCLSPNLQRDMGGFDKYLESAEKKDVKETYEVRYAEALSSLGNNTIELAYLLRSNFGNEFRGKAKLKKEGGKWMIVSDQGKKLIDVNKS